MKTEWTFESSSGTAVYTTKRNADGSLSCNCKGWTMKRGDGPRSCKHTIQVSGSAPAATPAKKNEPTAHVASAGKKVSRALPAPMLASAMIEAVKGKEFDATYAGWVMEEKHDGHRVGIVVDGTTVGAWSRPRAGAGETAKARDLPDTIIAAMSCLSPGIYDGELIVPGGHAWDVTAIGSRLMFIAFDILEIEGMDVMGRTYTERRKMLLRELAKLPKGQTAVSTTESKWAKWKEIEAIWKRGGEGAILKRPTSKYRPGHRSPEWVKVKAVLADTLTVTGFEEGKSGPCSKFVLRNADGITTTVKVPGNAMLREVTTNPKSFIGRRLVISFQQRTPSGTYRHAQFDHFAGEGE